MFVGLNSVAATCPLDVIVPEAIVPMFFKFLLKSINCTLVPSPIYKPLSEAVALSVLNLNSFLFDQVISLLGKPYAWKPASEAKTTFSSASLRLDLSVFLVSPAAIITESSAPKSRPPSCEILSSIVFSDPLLSIFNKGTDVVPS